MTNRDKMSKDDMIKEAITHIKDLKFSDKAVKGLSDVVINDRFPVLGFDVCKFGICWDFEIDGGLAQLPLDDIIDMVPGRVRNIDILVNGIIRRDSLRVRVEHEVR